MKRNSTTIFLESPHGSLNPTVTPLPWDGEKPDFSVVTDDFYRANLEEAWEAFKNSGDELEVIPDPESSPPGSNWHDFRVAFISDAVWDSWLPLGDLRSAVVAAVMDEDTGKLQRAFDTCKSIYALPENNWQTYANDNAIPVTLS